MNNDDKSTNMASPQLEHEDETGGDLLESSKCSESVDFDNVLKIIGVSVRYQVFQSVIIMSLWWPFAFGVLSFVFIGYEPPHVCAKTNDTELLTKYSLLNDSTAQVFYETCQIRITSNKTGYPEDVALAGCIQGHDFVGGKGVSLKTEWELVCDKTGVGELFQTMLNLGMAVGALIVNPLPDRFGRKRIILICSLFTVLFEFFVVFSPTIYVAIILKMFSGIFLHNLCIISNIFGQELLKTNNREMFAVVSIFSWTTGLICLGMIAYALQDYSWRTLQMCSSLIGVPPLLLLYFVDESITWLLAEGKHKQALKIINKMCKSNGTNFDAAERAYNLCVLRAKKTKENNDDYVAKYGFMDIYRHRKLFVTTLVLLLGYFTHNITYSGLYLTSATLNVNRYFMFIILSATEFPASILLYFFIRRLGRRTIVMMFLSMTAVCLLTSTFLTGLGSTSSEHISNASAAFFILGNASISISYSCFYAFTTEFYPTTLRNIGFGMTTFMARVGGMLSPFLYPLFKMANWAPGTLLSALCVFTVAVYPLVPETKGKELPTTIEAFENLFRKGHDNLYRKSQMKDKLKSGTIELGCYENLKM